MSPRYSPIHQISGVVRTPNASRCWFCADTTVQPVDLNDNRNLFVASVILIAGIGGLSVSFGKVTLTSIACALILGIIVNVVFNRRDKKAE